MTTEQLIETLSSVDVQLLTEKTVEQTAETIVELNINQMEDGIQQDGNVIRWQRDDHYPYTRPYARRKSQLGLQTSVVDLKLTGTFYQAEKVKVEGGNIDYYNEDEKAPFLEKNYGQQIHGLTDENKQAYREGVFAETFREKFTAETSLQFK